jgi:cellulose biosynthesis protein BcsQ
MAKIYFISNASNQSGKSTTAFNLALCFAAFGKETLLLDAGKSSWISDILKIESEFQLNKVSPFFSYSKSLDIFLNDFEIVLVDADLVNLESVFQSIPGSVKLLIPVESEYYGMNELQEFLNESEAINLDIEKFVPVMVRNNSVSSLKLIKELKSHFGNLVFEPGILRNYYLTRQKDFKEFHQSNLTEKAAVTYLNLANSLLET